VKALVALAVLALALIGSLAYLYNRHVQKQEDAVAAFALSEIDRKDEACRKPFQTEECKRYPIGCEIPLEGCEERKATAEQQWALTYPRQSAQRQANILEEKRNRDILNMKKQQ
jgi:hypothetical protein